MTELLSGDCAENRNRAGNLSRSLFYVCPVCGNVIWSVGEGAYSCCGVSLPPLEAEEPDEAHAIHAEKIETEWYVTLDHPMDKRHFIAFLAFVTGDRVQVARLYPSRRRPRASLSAGTADCTRTATITGCSACGCKSQDDQSTVIVDGIAAPGFSWPDPAP